MGLWTGALGQKMYFQATMNFKAKHSYRYPLFILSAVVHLIQDLNGNRYLVRQLVSTYLKNQYRRSFLGVAWLVVSPMLTVSVWWVLNYSGVVQPGTTGVPYLGFVLTGITLWNLFKGVYDLCSQSIAQFSGIILDTKVPTNTLLAVQFICSLIDFIIPFILNLLILLFLKFPFGMPSLLFFPALIPLLLFGASLGMIIGVCRVIAIDIANLFDKFMMFLMYLSPVVYSKNISNEILGNLLHFNPLTYFIHVPRQLLFASDTGSMYGYWICTSICCVIFLFCLYFFQKSERIIVERIYQ